MAQLLQRSATTRPQPGDMLVVIHDFNARSSDELTLRKSERVELIELDEGFGDGWYLGRHLAHGGTGLFPGVYTTKAPSTVRPMQANLVSRGSFGQSRTSPPDQQVLADTSTSVERTSVSPSSLSENDQTHGNTHVRAQDPPRTSLPPAYTKYIPGVQRSIGETLGSDRPEGEDSPVMNETLSVIDEHITDLSTPRQSVMPPGPIREDSESDYSSHLDRQSYVAGPETDDEEDRVHEADVRSWDHKKTAQHLRAIGVDPKHCDIFESQEITGDVLLDMDQSFVYMKEYDFGVMGRRLKTWHKIRDFQNEAKGRKMSRQSTFSSTADLNSSADDISNRSQSRAMSGSTYLPRIPSLMEKPGLNLRGSQQVQTMHSDSSIAPLQTGFARTSANINTPPSPWRSSMVGDSPNRPSAALVRELTHSRRHSSIDHGKQPESEQNIKRLSQTMSPHNKKDSFDRGWSMSGSTAVNTTASPSQMSMDTQREHSERAVTPQSNTPLTSDLDRGYFSGNEIDNRKTRNTLRKRDSGVSASHSRQSSANAAAVKVHARLPSADSIRDRSSVVNPAAKAYHSSGYKSRLRSASARAPNSRLSLPGGALTPPTVTNLEKDSTAASNRTASGTTNHTLSSMQTRAKKLIGIRAASDNTTHPEKPDHVASENFLDDSTKASPVATPTGSTTPSQTSHSLEYENSESSARVSQLATLGALPKTPARSRPKAKQETSAYTRGLLKISPEEARKTCDYYGWMKKKSSSLMTTWKPRLFVLRGRRLSYYYAETDMEERGIIDISGHKVLVANSDAMVTLHAQITGAKSAASPSPTSNPSSTEPSPVLTRTAESASGSPFYFKLIPPKSGLSRAVQFTKPAIHYFQVDSVIEGRKWMGELMKATIEHDWTTLETTNKQKTISLAKARARGERPAVLLGDAQGKDIEKVDIAGIKEKVDGGGLNIKGLDFNAQMALELIGENQNKENSEVVPEMKSALDTGEMKTA